MNECGLWFLTPVFELWGCKQIPSLKFTRIWLSGNYKVCMSDKDNQKILTQTFYHYFIFQIFQYQQLLGQPLNYLFKA